MGLIGFVVLGLVWIGLFGVGVILHRCVVGVVSGVVARQIDVK